MNSVDLQQIISDVLDHVRGMWRYRWWANSIAWILFLGGWLFICSLPNSYLASTRVYVDTNSLLTPLMKGLTATDNELDEVQLVSKAVLTRPNLEKVANQTDLALRAKTPEALEGLITRLQQRVHVTGGRDNIFTIEYQDVSREKARAVVAAVLDTFVENSIGNEGTDAEVTERAVAGEIKNHEQRLREAEEKLAKFKQNNLGYMPGEYGDYYKRLEAALGSVSQTQEKVRLLGERRDALKRQIDGEDPVLGIMPSATVQTGSQNCSQSGSIQQLEAQLSALRVEFTDKHPRVISLQETIAQLKKECAAEAETAHETGAVQAPQPAGVQPLEANPVYQNLKIQLSTSEVDLAEARAQLTTFQNQVAQLRRDVDKITEVEAQLKQLNRDYDVIQTRHQELLKRWEDLQAKKRLDPVTDNVQFRRIEPPYALADPVGPKRTLLLSAVLVLALGGGLVVAFGLNQLHPAYFTRNSLSKAVGIPVLGSITMILTPQAVRRSRAEALVWGGACIALVVCCGFAVLFAGQASALVRGLLGGVVA